MPSTFPGIDPYLEDPDIWPDFHDRFASQISANLNSVLPPPYYARLEMRREVGIVEDVGGGRRIVPDVSVVRHPRGQAGPSGVSVLSEPRTSFSKWIEVTFHRDAIRHHFVEIRDPTQGHKLITLIEIVSPSNKHPGPDRRAYTKKQREVLDSDASLIELDLLRTGERLFANPELEDAVRQMQPPPEMDGRA